MSQLISELRIRPREADLIQRSEHLLTALLSARRVCKLPALTGAACVAYGLPVVFAPEQQAAAR